MHSLENVDTSVERKLWYIFMLAPICLLFVGNIVELFLYPVGGLWGESGTNVEYHTFLFGFDDFLFYTAQLCWNCVPYVACVIAIKIILSNTTTSDQKHSEKRNAKICMGILLFLNIIIIIFSGTDYLIITSFSFIILWIIMAAFYINWKKHRRYGVIEDILLFDNGFTKALLRMIAMAGIIIFLSTFFLVWYEGDWANDYYPYEYSNSLFSDFDTMIMILTIIGIVIGATGIIGLVANKHSEEIRRNSAKSERPHSKH